MCGVCLAEAPTDRQVAVYDLTVAEVRLSAATFERRRDKVINPVVKRITGDLQQVFRVEQERVLDLLNQAVLPYTPGIVLEADVPTADALTQLLLSGVDISQYLAALEDAYRSTMPGAMDATVMTALTAAGIRYWRSPSGQLFIRDGVRLVRFAGAEQWIRDHSIQFSRRWAPTVTARTNAMIRAQMAAGFGKFESIEELRTRVQGVYKTASDVRAKMIARTETSRAYNAAFGETGRQLGIQKKYWILSGTPYSLVDVCSDNLHMGTIDINATFRNSSGGQITGPPAHPNCMCSMGLDVSDAWELPGQFQLAA